MMRILALFILLFANASCEHRQPEKCGLQKVKTRELIVRGYGSYPGQFPWHVAIFQRKSKIRTDYACGGSLISRSFVLTAAHCTKGEDGYEIRANLVKVFLGLHDKEFIGPNVQQHSVYGIHTVPSEVPWVGLKNDVALLELGSNVEYTNFVQPICLNFEQIPNRVIGTVPGWGRTEAEDISEVLKMASMPIISTLNCLQSNRDVFGGALDTGMICAGHQNGTSVCNGDSGGGLVVQRCTDEGCSWSQVGVLSFSAGNATGHCRSDGYGAFSNVQTYLPWISQITGMQFGEDISQYVCGHQQDETTTRARWPWHGTAYRKNPSFPIKDCNSYDVTILSNQIVLTIHAFIYCYQKDPESYRVRVGYPAVGISDEFTQEFPIETEFTSAQQTPHTRNLLILKLKGRIQFTKYVQPICLRPPEDSSFSSIVNQNGYLVSHGQHCYGDQPEEMVMPIVKKSKCHKDHLSLSVATFNAKLYCAGTRNGTGPSDLDVGTGLFVQRGNNWFLAGALFELASPVFYAPKSFHTKHYAMFLDVTHFSNWIISTIKYIHGPKAPFLWWAEQQYPRKNSFVAETRNLFDSVANAVNFKRTFPLIVKKLAEKKIYSETEISPQNQELIKQRNEFINPFFKNLY